MAKRAPFTLEVREARRISPSVLRVTLGGAGMAEFPNGSAGGYIKLMPITPAEGAKPLMRTYTIRNQRADEIDVDFALHGGGEAQAGPATRWALAARPGDTIAIGGPGAAKPLPAGHDFYLVAGDMTALPAIAVNLEALAPDARGLVVIEVQGEADRQDLKAPSGIAIRWVVQPEPGTRPDLVADELVPARAEAGSTYVWAACEFSAMRRLRSLVRDEWQMPAGTFYLSSYWKHGLAEDAHKLVKREDAEADEAVRATA